LKTLCDDDALKGRGFQSRRMLSEFPKIPPALGVIPSEAVLPAKRGISLINAFLSKDDPFNQNSFFVRLKEVLVILCKQ
jgi:hypothetical protein